MWSWLASSGLLLEEAHTEETNCSTRDREQLACVTALRNFCFLVEGWAFTLNTDEKPLTYLLCKQADAWLARQQRHLSKLRISSMCRGRKTW